MRSFQAECFPIVADGSHRHPEISPQIPRKYDAEYERDDKKQYAEREVIGPVHGRWYQLVHIADERANVEKRDIRFTHHVQVY